jgi:hypothetical protein
VFLIFKPPQSILQVQIQDPDGYKRYTLEEELALQLLTERRPKRKRKQSKLSFKDKIETRLREGDAPEVIAADLAESVLTEEQPIPVKPGVDFLRLAAEYERQVKAEIAAIVQARAAELQARAKAEEEQRLALVEAARLEAVRLEEERLAAVRAEEERQRILKARKVRALLLLATMDDE